MNQRQRRRRETLRSRYEGGETLREIADAEGISVERVRQLICKQPVDRAAMRRRNNVRAILQRTVRRTS
jgi:DNA-directed RNA polymerase specialized sigma24 family protein